MKLKDVATIVNNDCNYFMKQKAPKRPYSDKY
jgi:hypothetical protein